MHILGEQGHFSFARFEYDDVIVDGRAEFWDRYIAANPVGAGLVSKPEFWRGISSVPYITNNSKVVARGLNVSEYNNACRHGRKVRRKDFIETFPFEMATPPRVPQSVQNNPTPFLSEVISDSGRVARKARKGFAPMGIIKSTDPVAF